LISIWIVFAMMDLTSGAKAPFFFLLRMWHG